MMWCSHRRQYHHGCGGGIHLRSVFLKNAVVKPVDGTLKRTRSVHRVCADNAAFCRFGINTGTVSIPPDDNLKPSCSTILGDKVLSGNVPAGPNAKVITAGSDSRFCNPQSERCICEWYPGCQADSWRRQRRYSHAKKR